MLADLRTKSLWLDTAPERVGRPALDGDLNVDVVVAGGGIVGLTTALHLARRGRNVAVLEARWLGSGVTGHTTAKLSSLQGTIYQRLISKHDVATARAYAAANEAGIAAVARLVEELGIECDLRRRPNFTYAPTATELDEIQHEVSAARDANLPVMAAEVGDDLPFPTAGAVRLDDQAEFHPQKYLLGLALAVEAAGGQVFEGARAMRVASRGTPTVTTDHDHKVTADRVIVATHHPTLDRGLYFARMHPERSYAMALRVRGGVPTGMYLSAGSTTRSIRTHPVDGEELLLVGGEGHKVGQGDEAGSYERLAAWAREHWDVEAITHRWSSQDNMPADLLPYVGRLWPFSDRILTATGFRKWGLAMGTTAAEMLADRVTGRESRWEPTFDSSRLNPVASAPDLAKENSNVGYRFFRDRLQRGSGDGIAPGEGRVVSSGLGQTAVYRDDDGVLHAVSARCTHLGCILRFNDGERSWDCPCHGSRFGPDGGVLQGPAVTPLQRRQV